VRDDHSLARELLVRADSRVLRAGRYRRAGRYGRTQGGSVACWKAGDPAPLRALRAATRDDPSRVY